MIDALLDLPPHLRERLASALESGLLGPSPTPTALRSVLGSREGGEDLVTSLLDLGRLGISGSAAAAWLRTIAHAAARTPKPDLVWSGPEVPGLHARDTRRVYEELLGCAERSIWASTYVWPRYMGDGPPAKTSPPPERAVAQEEGWILGVPGLIRAGKGCDDSAKSTTSIAN